MRPQRHVVNSFTRSDALGYHLLPLRGFEKQPLIGLGYILEAATRLTLKFLDVRSLVDVPENV